MLHVEQFNNFAKNAINNLKEEEMLIAKHIVEKMVKTKTMPEELKKLFG